MDSKDLDNRLKIIKIEEKIFKFKAMYHPNLITNLSKEAYDLYLIRNLINEKLLKLTEKKEIDINAIKEFVNNEINLNNEKIRNSSNNQEINLLKLTNKEWKEVIE